MEGAISSKPLDEGKPVKIVGLIDAGAVFSVIHTKHAEHVEIELSDVCMVAANNTTTHI